MNEEINTGFLVMQEIEKVKRKVSIVYSKTLFFYKSVEKFILLARLKVNLGKQ